jgi:hypothetical protein
MDTDEELSMPGGGGSGDDDYVHSTECVTWNDKMFDGLGLIWGTTLEFSGGTEKVYDKPSLCNLCPIGGLNQSSSETYYMWVF